MPKRNADEPVSQKSRSSISPIETKIPKIVPGSGEKPRLKSVSTSKSPSPAPPTPTKSGDPRKRKRSLEDGDSDREHKADRGVRIKVEKPDPEPEDEGKVIKVKTEPVDPDVQTASGSSTGQPEDTTQIVDTIPRFEANREDPVGLIALREELFVSFCKSYNILMH